MEYKVASLFAGVGGICSAFNRSKITYNNQNYEYRILWANEFDSEACKTYRTNYNHKLIEGDIETILNVKRSISLRKFLVFRQNELEEFVEQHILAFDKNLIKHAVNSLKPNYLSNAIKNNPILISSSLEKKIKKACLNLENISFDKYLKNFLLVVEAKIIESELQQKNIEWLEKIERDSSIKQQEMLKEPIDILNGGFPCQAFSLAGEARGFEDHRGELFYSFIDLINLLKNRGYKKPRVLLLENVKNLVGHDKGNTFKVISNELENLGYELKYKVLNTYEYSNLPQNRERIFIVAFLDKRDYEVFGSLDDLEKIVSTKVERKEWIKKIIDETITYKSNPEYYYTKEKYPHYFGDGKINIEKTITESYEFYQIRRGQYIRVNTNGVCPTLTANMGMGGHNIPLIKVKDGIRKLSIEECFKLQGFRVGEDFKIPTDVSRASLYKQAGNAVSIDIVEKITNKILHTLAIVDNK